jgi:hypothetical protein
MLITIQARTVVYLKAVEISRVSAWFWPSTKCTLMTYFGSVQNVR